MANHHNSRRDFLGTLAATGAIAATQFTPLWCWVLDFVLDGIA